MASPRIHRHWSYEVTVQDAPPSELRAKPFFQPRYRFEVTTGSIARAGVSKRPKIASSGRPASARRQRVPPATPLRKPSPWTQAYRVGCCGSIARVWIEEAKSPRFPRLQVAPASVLL